MLIKNIKGRLGNQMFQYAMMYAAKQRYFKDQEIGLCFEKVEKKANKEGFFEVNSLKHFPNLEYREIPKIEMTGRQKMLIFRLSFRLFLHKYFRKNTYPTYRDKLEGKYQKKLIENNIVWRTSGFEKFDFKGLDPKKDIIFYGYFEAPAYFSRLKKTLKTGFTPKETLKRTNEEMLAEIEKARNPVCVSVQRGDSDHAICDEKYFEKAMKKCKELISHPRFFVFSDDPEWAEKNLNFPRGTVFEQPGAKLPERIELMAACKHYIISNDTFDWWMQYLNRDENTVVIAPDRWNDTGENADIYEREWTLISIPTEAAKPETKAKTEPEPEPKPQPAKKPHKSPSRFRRALRQIRPKDFLAPLILLLMIIPALIFRLINKIEKRKLWLICEGKDSARDNGYYFYKYLRENHLDCFCFYAVDKKSEAYEKVKPLGNIIQFGGLKHWLYYLAADLNISNQKNGNPSTLLFYILHVNLGFMKNRVFLQHGITKDDSPWIYYKKTKFKYFVCGTKREHQYISDKFGYKPESLLLTGFPRWDTLINKSGKQKSILIMPTWRKWLGGETNTLGRAKNFTETDFYKSWNSLINNGQLIDLVEKNDIEVFFYLHINMQKFAEYFNSPSKNIKILTIEHDIQEYLRKCDLLVTDYSSVAFDFAFLKKPIVYYQFDLERYRKEQLQEGYFSYEKDGFGEIVKTEDALMADISNIVQKEFKNDSIYEARMAEFFTVNDRSNSRRLYSELIRERQQ